MWEPPLHATLDASLSPRIPLEALGGKEEQKVSKLAVRHLASLGVQVSV